MLRRPLIWALGALSIGLAVAFAAGASTESSTPLSRAVGRESVPAIAEGTITQISTGGSGDRLSLVSCAVRTGSYAGPVLRYGDALETDGLLVYADRAGDLREGDRIEVRGTLRPFEPPDNPGEFDRRLYYLTAGYDYSLSAAKIRVISTPEGISGLRITGSVRRALSDAIDAAAADRSEAGLFKAVFLGDRSALDDGTYELFRQCGIAHILAVSGLHLSLIGHAVLALLRRLRLPYAVCAAVADGLLLFYVLILDGRPSAWRAYIMFTVSLAAPAAGRTYDLLSAMGLAGILMLIKQPLYILDSAFQLSFAAVFGVGALYPALRTVADPGKKSGAGAAAGQRQGAGTAPAARPAAKLLKDSKIAEGARSAARYIVSTALPGLSIWLATLPAAAHSYYSVSLIGIILNLIAIPLASLIVISVSLAAIAGMLFPAAGTFLAGTAHYGFALLIKLCEGASQLSGTAFVTGDPGTVKILIYATMLGASVAAARRIGTRKRRSAKDADRKTADSKSAGSKSTDSKKAGRQTADTINVDMKASGRKDSCRKAAAGISIDRKAAAGKRFLPMAFTDRQLRAAALALALLAPLVFIPVHGGDTSVTALYVGQGDSSVIDCGRGHCALIDCGSSSLDDAAGRVILPYIKYCGFDRIDAIFLSHPDGDHVNALPGILADRSVEVGAVIIPRGTAEAGEKDGTADEANEAAGAGDWSQIVAQCARAGVPVLTADVGDRIDIGGASFTVISPSAPGGGLNFGDANEDSMVLLARIGDLRALFTGDIGELAEAALVGTGMLGDVDYLKCAHHGSRFSSSREFLEAVTPAVTVASAGRNNLYGHPAEETLERLTAAGSRAFVTARSGAVTTRYAGGRLTVSLFRREE